MSQGRRPTKKEIERMKARRLRRRRIQRICLLVVIAAIIVAAVVVAVTIAKRVSASKEARQSTGTQASQMPGAQGNIPEIDSVAGEAILSAEQEVAEAEPDPDPISITMSFVGDCTLGTDENFAYSTSFNAYYDSYGSDYFFQNVVDVFSQDDLTVANLEGTFTTLNTREDKTYAFKADPSWVQILPDGSVEVVNMANNHSFDYGRDSYEETKQTLTDAGIPYFGYDNILIQDVNGVKVGFSGINVLPSVDNARELLEQNIQNLKDQGAQVIVTVFHWGIEKDYAPTGDQVELARMAVDLGANLVIGHHPHVLQGIEEYHGAYICYSLGNFCFGGNSNPSDKDTMIFQQTFTINGDGTLADVEESDIHIIPCSLSSSYGINDYRPRVCEGDEGEAILQKIENISSYIPAQSEE